MRYLLALAFLLVASGTAFAQYGNPYPFRNTAVDTALSNYANKQIIDLAMDRQSGKKGRTTAKPAVNHAPLSASDFKASKTRPIVDAFFAKTKLDFIAMSDLRPVVDQTFVLVESNLRKHNVATAMGFVIATSLLIARNTDLGDEAVHELIAGVNDKLVASPAFKTMKASDRQAMYDSLILTGAVLITLNTLGENDEGRKADAMELADAILKSTGYSN